MPSSLLDICNHYWRLDSKIIDYNLYSAIEMRKIALFFVLVLSWFSEGISDNRTKASQKKITDGIFNIFHIAFRPRCRDICRLNVKLSRFLLNKTWCITSYSFRLHSKVLETQKHFMVTTRQLHNLNRIAGHLMLSFISI